jgi:hypothetical protein
MVRGEPTSFIMEQAVHSSVGVKMVREPQKIQNPHAMGKHVGMNIGVMIVESNANMMLQKLHCRTKNKWTQEALLE